jgi:hypothetical protein
VAADARHLGHETTLCFLRGAAGQKASGIPDATSRLFEDISEEPTKPRAFVRIVPLSMASSANE